MGKQATKAAGNVWYQARKKAANYNDRLNSREGAAELLGMSVSAVADAELGLSKTMPVDKAVQMAELYNAPELLYHYCLSECPIGARMPVSDRVLSIDRIAVQIAKELNTSRIQSVKDKLIEIAASDGEVTEEDMDALSDIVDYFDEISKRFAELKVLQMTMAAQRGRQAG